jgi:hypothetical protein
MKHCPVETGVSRQANGTHLRRHEAVGGEDVLECLE